MKLEPVWLLSASSMSLSFQGKLLPLQSSVYLSLQTSIYMQQFSVRAIWVWQMPQIFSRPIIKRGNTVNWRKQLWTAVCNFMGCETCCLPFSQLPSAPFIAIHIYWMGSFPFWFTVLWSCHVSWGSFYAYYRCYLHAAGLCYLGFLCHGLKAVQN